MKNAKRGKKRDKRKKRSKHAKSPVRPTSKRTKAAGTKKRQLPRSQPAIAEDVYGSVELDDERDEHEGLSGETDEGRSMDDDKG